jgi:hypothetical protein
MVILNYPLLACSSLMRDLLMRLRHEARAVKSWLRQVYFVEILLCPLHELFLHFRAGAMTMVVSTMALPFQEPRLCNGAASYSIEWHVINQNALETSDNSKQSAVCSFTFFTDWLFCTATNLHLHNSHKSSEWFVVHLPLLYTKMGHDIFLIHVLTNLFRSISLYLINILTFCRVPSWLIARISSSQQLPFR